MRDGKIVTDRRQEPRLAEPETRANEAAS
jgi:hypothetical protein